MNCRRWSSLALATLTMYCMMRPAFAQLGENAVTVPIEVQQQIASHLPLTKPNRILQRYVVTEDLNNKTRGSTSTSDVRAELYLLDNGLTGFVRSSVARSGAVQGNGQGITLCGLVSLIVETGMNVASTVPIIAGKLFIPYGMKSDTQLNARFRLVSFSSDISTICAPSPNTVSATFVL